MLLGIGSVLFSAVLFGIIPLLTKVLYAAGFDAISVAFYRHVCVLPILFLYCRIKKSSLRLSLRQLFQLSLYAGFFSAVTMLLLNLSYLYIPVGMATTLHFLYPAFVILICVVYYRQQIERPILCSLILVLFGIFCFFEQGSIQGMAGIALALLSAITYAVYLIQLERHRFNQMDSAVFTFYLSLCTIVMLMIVNLFTCSIQESLSCFNDMPLWLLGLLTVFSMFANICIAFGSRYLGASMTALFSLFEPITSLVSGFIFLNEQLTVLKVAGSVIIMTAIVNVALFQRRKQQEISGK